MSTFKTALRCLFTPRLYRVYSSGNGTSLPNYEPFRMEQWGDNVISTVWTFCNMSMYASPLILFYMMKKEALTGEGLATLARLAGALGAALAAALLVRAAGRARNPVYRDFLRAVESNDASRVQVLRRYDFEFSAFPVTYCAHAKEGVVEEKSSKKKSEWWQELSPLRAAAALAVKVFGLRLVYPGTLGVLQAFVWGELVRGRARLVEEQGGARHKVRAADGNMIDCMVVDRRAQLARRAHTLVVCCEGNSGFYEVGVMATPLAAGYSVLGWNHPGFAGSTGLPYPASEQAAVDAVMQLATLELEFPAERVVLFGWSIGGYAAAWAANNYPDIRCLVLDATFDDLAPLAEARMPATWAPLVRAAVRGHVDLCVGALVEQYAGPLRLVRRVHDEIICIKEGDISTNCINPLVERVLAARHGALLSAAAAAAVREYLALAPPPAPAQRDMLERLDRDFDPDARAAVRLVREYLADVSATHCAPLPADQFLLPPALQ